MKSDGICDQSRSDFDQNRVYMHTDHEELKIFLLTCLIPSRFNQELSLQRERTSIYREVCAKLVDRGPRRGFHSV